MRNRFGFLNSDGDTSKKLSVTPRDAVALLQAVGFALAGVASVTREVRRSAESYRRKREANRPPRVVTLYRPVGEAERALIEASCFRAFPPRLPHQPIFYPVLNEGYAVQIARDWNTQDPASGYAGFVTRFHVRADFLTAYETHTVGAARHREYWIPAEDLGAFNRHLVGEIDIIAAFRGDGEDSGEESHIK